MGRHAKARHVDADDAHTVDRIGQQLQRHTRSGRHAQIGHHDRVVFFRVGHVVHSVADILEQLAGNQCFRIERHIAHRAPRSVEVRREGEAINAAGRAGQDGGGAAHAQANAQRTEGRAHGLRLVVRALGIIGRIAIQHFRLAGLGRCIAHRVGAGVAAGAVCRRLGSGRNCQVFRHCRTPLPGSASSHRRRRAYRPEKPVSG